MPVEMILFISVTNACKNSFRFFGLPTPHQMAITIGFMLGIPVLSASSHNANKIFTLIQLDII